MLESDHGPVDGLLHEVWQSVRTIDSGQVADYIPELAKADPSTCGLSLATLDGAVYTAGDLVPFTIQSVSKPFVYALALADSGAETVLSKIGAEPTGDPFNTISLDDVSGRAFNPMVNAGAIVTATLVAGRTRAEQFDRILDGLSAFAGRALDVDEDVYASERDTGDRNRAIAYLMRSAGLLDHDVDDQVEMYFRQCSIVVTARDLAVMAATLANAGVNPTTGEQVIPRHVVAPGADRDEHLRDVRLRRRVALPGRDAGQERGERGHLGGPARARWGSRRTARGWIRGATASGEWRRASSCRRGSGCTCCCRPSGPGPTSAAPTGGIWSGPSAPGRPRIGRCWRPRAGRSWSTSSSATRGSPGVESLVRTVLSDPEPARWRVLDMGRVTRIDVAARTLLGGLVEQLQSAEVVVGLVEPRGRGPREVAGALGEDMPRFADSDSALEWCETQLLRSHGIEESLDEGLVALADQDLLSGLPAEVVAEIEARTTTRVFTSGTVVFNEGDDPDGLYFIGAGQVSADVRVRGQRGRRRLNSMAAGSSFGELALVDGRPRSTRIAALESTICFVLSPEGFEDLRVEAPDACAQLTLAIARSLSQRLRASTSEVATLEES